jgi:hypothetical protein
MGQTSEHDIIYNNCFFQILLFKCTTPFSISRSLPLLAWHATPSSAGGTQGALGAATKTSSHDCVLIYHTHSTREQLRLTHPLTDQ